MELLEAYELLNYVSESLSPDKRVQISKNKFEDIKNSIFSAIQKLGEDVQKSGTVSAILIDLVDTFRLVDKMELSAIPDDLRLALADATLRLEKAVANKLYDYYEVNEITLTPEIISLLRKAMLQKFM